MKTYDAEVLVQSLTELENGNNECWTPAEFKDYLFENQKVIEAEPVRYGHWERSKDFYGFVRCSNCKSKKSEHWHIEDEWEYCNCCSCKMIKENEK